MISPMLCQAATAPVTDPDWIAELKFDGVRCVAEGPKLYSRSGRDITAQFPEVSEAMAAIGNVVLDGEIVVIRDGVPDFPATAGRTHLAGPSEIALRRRIAPASFIAFDLLTSEGANAMPFPWRVRRAMLERLAFGSVIKLSAAVSGDQIPALYKLTLDKGLEGIVMKDRRAPYVPGGRLPYWKKLKGLKEGVFVVGGLTRGTGWRERTFGALVIGKPNGEGGLEPVGEVGTGFNQWTLEQLMGLLSVYKSDQCPFARGPKVDNLMTWLAPVVKVEVSYQETTKEGQLRFPSFKRVCQEEKHDRNP